MGFVFKSNGLLYSGGGWRAGMDVMYGCIVVHVFNFFVCYEVVFKPPPAPLPFYSWDGSYYFMYVFYQGAYAWCVGLVYFFIRRKNYF